MDIGTRIKNRREFLGMSQEELAKKAGYKSRSSINKIELDGRGLPQRKLVAIANALETTPAYLMGWEVITEEQLRMLDEAVAIQNMFSRENNVLAVEGNSKRDYVITVSTTRDKHLLLEIYDKLNESGKAEALKRVEELTEIPRYTAASGNITPVVPAEPLVSAAHTRTDIKVTKEMRKHDDDIMKDSTNWE